MFVDCKNYITRLSDETPGMKNLKRIKEFIWNTLNLILMSNNGKKINKLEEIISDTII